MSNKATPTTLYTEPQVSTTNPNDWFVWFRYYHGDKWHLIKRREGINRHDKKKRRLAVEALRYSRHEWLKKGWNPVIDPDYKLNKIQKGKMNFIEALDYAMSKKKLKKKSKLDYGNMLKHIKEIAKAEGYAGIDIEEMKRGLLLDLMDVCNGYGINAGYKMFNEKLTVSVGVSNFMEKYHLYKLVTKDPIFQYTSMSNFLFRGISFSLSWNFGKLTESVSKKKGVVNDDLLNTGQGNN